MAAVSLASCAQPGNNGSGSGGNNGSGGSNNNSGGSNGSGSGGNNSSGGNNGSGGVVLTGNGGNSSSGGSTGSGGAKGGSTGSGGSVSSGGSTGSGGSVSSGGSTGSGGSTSSGGSTGSGGSSTGSGGSSAGDPPGYFRTSEWNVSSVDWHGCVWTGIDTVASTTTTVTPQDFTAKSPNGGPYEVSGSVFNDYNAVALLGFNLNEATTGSSTQCKYNAAAATQAGPPTATIPSSATGIAVNWSEAKAPPTSFRIQIQAADGATNANDRWCATITDASGPSFIKFTDFYTQCWNVGVSGMSPGTAFNPSSNSIDAVVFLVPGTTSMKAPFDFTVVGFAPGTSKSDAPGMKAACGTTTGTLGSSTASMTASYARAAVTGTDCKEYIIQNNNWGNPTGSTQVINYTGSSFTVQSSSGSGSSAPASFPSTYIGANGNIANGTYNTWSDSGLPKQISSMQSVMTNFAWSGGSSGGDFNATYDVWFAKSPPTAGAYNDGISGFIMVWLYKPSSRQPIGSVARTATIAGHTWNVWVGPRGNTSTGTDSASRPVISYVAQDSPVSSLNFDLKNFIDDAVSHADTSNGVSGPFSSSWYLTDVFAGFEIWNGGNASNLKSTGFTCAVK